MCKISHFLSGSIELLAEWVGEKANLSNSGFLLTYNKYIVRRHVISNVNF